MIDFHSHILPAFDDGAVTVDESIVMAKALADFGYKTVCCTPHCIKGTYDLTPQKVRETTMMLQADLDNADAVSYDQANLAFTVADRLVEADWGLALNLGGRGLTY